MILKTSLKNRLPCPLVGGAFPCLLFSLLFQAKANYVVANRNDSNAVGLKLQGLSIS